MLVDMKVLYVFNMCDRSFVLVGDDNVDGKDNEEEEIMEVVDNRTSYLSFFLHGQNFWIIKFTPKNANFSR